MGRSVWLDGAHNLSSVSALKQTISSQFSEEVTLVMGVSEDKDVKGMLSALRPVAGKVICTGVNNERALPPIILKEIADALGMNAEIAETPDNAVDRAMETASPIVILGSLYLVGEIYRMAGYTADDLKVFTPGI